MNVFVFECYKSDLILDLSERSSVPAQVWVYFDWSFLVLYMFSQM